MAHIAAVPDEGRTIRRYPLATGQTPLEGAAVYLVSGEVTICAADPATVLGFMACDYGGALEIDPYNGDAMVYVAKPGSTFWLTGSTTPSDLSEIGELSGVAHEATTEITYLDLTDNNVLLCEDVDLIRGLFKVSIIASVRQLHV